MSRMKGSQAFTRSATSRAGLAAALLLGFAMAASGGISYWTNTVGSAFVFNDGSNWNTSAAPGSGDDAVFNAPTLNGVVSFSTPVTNARWVFQSGNVTFNGGAGTTNTLNGSGTGLYVAPTNAVTARVAITSGVVNMTAGAIQAGRSAYSGTTHASSRSEIVVSGSGTVLRNYSTGATILLGDNAPASLIITNGAQLIEGSPSTAGEKIYFTGRNDTIFRVTGQGSHVSSQINNPNAPGLYVVSPVNAGQEALALFDNGATASLRRGIQVGASAGRARVRITGVGTEVKYRAAPIRLGAAGTRSHGTLEILNGGKVIADNESGSDLNIGEFNLNTVTGVVMIAGNGAMFSSPYDRSVAIRVGSSPTGAVGRLTIGLGGSMIATNANLGAGRSVHAHIVRGIVSLEGGTMKVDHLTATNASSTLRFVMGTAGSGTITLRGNLTVSSGTKVEVDDTDYAALDEVELIRYAAQVGALAPGNISVTGKGTVVEDAPNLRIVYIPPPRGTVISIR